MFYYKILLCFFSFKYCIKKNKKREFSNQPPDDALLKEIRTAIYRANLLAVWKNKCLVISLAARKMVEKRGIASTMHFGVRFVHAKQLEAHAWLTVGDFYITQSWTDNHQEFTFQ
ncbi:MAG: lasso peptide biosynthesis B2 protein [Bacteroides sp.]